jgi:exosortase
MLGPTGRRELWPLALILLSPLPLFAEHLHNLWRVKPHYQFFPLLLIGFGCLLGQRWPHTWRVAAPSRWGVAFLGGGLMVLIAAVWLSSPWLAGVATLLSIAGVIFRLPGRPTWREWLPVWALLWLVIPPPLGWDLLFIQRLQSFTSRASSLILDAWGVRHLMEGNVLVLPGQRLLVEEACSGVNSTFVLLAATALFVVAARRPLLRSGFMLIGSVGWSALGNIVRVVAIAVAQSEYGLDWSTGWQHEVLGVCTFAFAFWMVVSTDLLLTFLLGPIECLDDDEKVSDVSFRAWDSHRNPLTRIWNWFAGVRWSPANRMPAEGAPPDPADEGNFEATGGGSVSRWFAAGFVGVAILQLATWVIPVSPRDDERDLTQPWARLDRFERPDLPATIAGWTQVNYGTEEHARTMGRFRHIWTYQSGRSECLVSVDYPFSGWHDLSACYVGAGWQIDRRARWPARSAIAARLEPYVEVELKKSGDERGLLLFCNVHEATSEILDDDSTLSWRRIVRRVNRNRFSRGTGEILQIQAFIVSLDAWSSSERESVHQLFVAARQQLLAVPNTGQERSSP